MWWILSFIILFENLWVSAVNGQLHSSAVPTAGVCKDNITTCSQYGKIACQGQFLSWSKQYCAKYCGFCHAYGNCHDGWTNVLQTESNGSVVSGSKVALRGAILNGAELQIYVPGWNYVTSTQQVSAFNNSIEVCAQALFHISKDSWKTFRHDAYWYFLLICTTGQIEKSIWYVSSHTRPSAINLPQDSTSREHILWFIRSSKYQPVYCNSDKNIQTCGSLQDLVNAVIHGADIKIANMGSSSIGAVLTMGKSNKTVIGVELWTMGIEKRGGHEMFQKSSYSLFTMYGTGDLHGNPVNKAKIEWLNGPEIQHIPTPQPMKWLADTCWSLAYKHDSNGTAIDGSLHSLRSAVESGHRLKIVLTFANIELFHIDNSTKISIEADNILERSADISVQMNSIFGGIHLSTSGDYVNVLSQDGTTSIDESLLVIDAEWYIDSRHWTHVLTTSEIGTAILGSKSALIQYIRKGSMLRCVIHFSTDHILAAQADNIEISPDGTNIGAQLMHIISYTIDGTSSRKFEKKFYWRFTIVTTEGTISHLEWMVRNQTSDVTNSTSAVIDWFVD